MGPYLTRVAGGNRQTSASADGASPETPLDPPFRSHSMQCTESGQVAEEGRSAGNHGYFRSRFVFRWRLASGSAIGPTVSCLRGRLRAEFVREGGGNGKTVPMHSERRSEVRAALARRRSEGSALPGAEPAHVGRDPEQ
jgi:hypothetical protein